MVFKNPGSFWTRNTDLSWRYRYPDSPIYSSFNAQWAVCTEQLHLGCNCIYCLNFHVKPVVDLLELFARHIADQLPGFDVIGIMRLTEVQPFLLIIYHWLFITTLQGSHRDFFGISRENTLSGLPRDLFWWENLPCQVFPLEIPKNPYGFPIK